MYKYLLSCAICFLFCAACFALAARSSLYSLWDVGGYLTGGIAAWCLLSLLRKS